MCPAGLTSAAKFIVTALLGTLSAASASAALSTSETRRIEDAATVLRELHAAPDQDVPMDLWEKASCVMVDALLEEGRLHRRRRVR